MKMVLSTGSFSCKSNAFSYERICTRTRFETKGPGNSEMAYKVRNYHNNYSKERLRHKFVSKFVSLPLIIIKPSFI